MPNWLHPLVLILAGFALLCCFSNSFHSNDGWWHLEMGKYVFDNRRLPVPDPFGFATYLRGPAYPGEDIVRHFNLTQEWLTEVVFYPVYLLGGYGALVLLRNLLLMAACGAVGLLAWRRTARFYLSVAAALAPAAVLYLTATDRPHLFTIFFTAVFLLVLDARRPLWLLPPLALLWANFHGGFIMSWILVGAFCAEALYQRLRGQPPAGELRLWLSSIATVLASLANPNGWNAVTTVLYFRHSKMLSVIAEWRPTVLWPPGGFMLLLVAGTAVLLWARGKARFADVLLFALFGLAGVYAVRNVIFIGLFAPAVIATYFPWKTRPLPAAAGFAIAAAILAIGVVRIAEGQALQFHAQLATRPAGAADFLLAHHIGGRIYNHLEDGGYLMWRLWPNDLVFVDGRLLNETVYRDYRLLTYDIDAGEPPLRILDDYGIQTLVVNGFEYTAGEPHMLMVALANPAQTVWKLVYKDTVSAVFVRQPLPGIGPIANTEIIPAMADECAEHMSAVPSEPNCARGMAKLFQHLRDITDARRWMAFYLGHKLEPDPEAERQYQMMLAGGR
ncbi:MAG: hypothetical protein ABSH56_35640 [Bryobacteraceae bacterium]